MGEGNLGRLVEWLDVSSNLHIGRVVTGPLGEVVADGKTLAVDTSFDRPELAWINNGILRDPVTR